MLPRNARLTSPIDFAKTTKSGNRLAGKSMVLYICPTIEPVPARFGLIIGKNIGGSVVRHRLARQIRHILKDHISNFPVGALVVVRALPNLSSLRSRDIVEELERLILKMREKALATL